MNMSVMARELYFHVFFFAYIVPVIGEQPKAFGTPFAQAHVTSTKHSAK